MITPQDVERLTRSTERQCLTLYFNTRPDQPRAGYQARFRSLLRTVETSVAAEDRKPFDQLVAKVANFLSQYQPAGNSFLVFATPKSWDEFASRVPVRDEVWWGQPNTAQLLWLLEEYRPYGVLIAGPEHVRFLAVRLNEFEEFREFRAEIDTSEWRKQRVGSSGRGKAVQKGGRDIEAWDNRYMEQVRRFWRTLHKPLGELAERFHIRRLVLAGNKSLLPEFAKALPAGLNGKVVAQLNLETFTSPADAVKRVFPEIVAWEQKRDTAVVADLLNAAGISHKAAVGLDPVLKFVQDGRAARLVVAKDFDRDTSRCAKCLHVNAGLNGECPRCGSKEMEKANVAAVLPRLVLQYGLPVEVVKGEAAAELTRNGGLGVFLRF